MEKIQSQARLVLDQALDKIFKCVQFLERVKLSQQMPDGWKELLDEKADKIYFQHQKTMRTAWALPKDVGRGVGAQECGRRCRRT